jgi:hypothetical protein
VRKPWNGCGINITFSPTQIDSATRTQRVDSDYCPLTVRMTGTGQLKSVPGRLAATSSRQI